MSFRPPVVGLSGRAGSGKTTVAKYLINSRGYHSLPNAGAMQRMMHVYFEACGLDPDEIAARLLGDRKRTPCLHLGGKTPTEAMQALGAEWGREAISEDIWIRPWRRIAEETLRVKKPVVSDSVRYANEAQAVRELGGVVLRVEGRVEATTGFNHLHSTETGLRTFEPDLVVQNGSDIETLCANVNRALVLWQAGGGKGI